MSQQSYVGTQNVNVVFLFNAIKENVRRLKSYGVKEEDIESVLHQDVTLPVLTIKRDYRIILSNVGDREVVLEPLVKAVYLLLLRHPEGIVQKYLPDYCEELMQIYLRLKPGVQRIKAKKSIEDVTDPLQNSFNEKCARIKRAFSEVLPRSEASYCVVSGKRGEAKFITLPRTNVVWE